MRVFVTGATGFIGSYLVPELIDAGHHVLGLTRSDAGAETLTRAGAEVIRGDVNDLDRLRSAVEAADSGPATETDDPVSSAVFPRAATEEAAGTVVAKGGRVIVMRLPQVHDTRHQGRIAQHIELARQKGWVAYVGKGENRLSAVHVSDATRLFRLALEKGQAGARYHAVGEEGVAMRDIAEEIGAGLKVPVESIAPEETSEYFGWIAGLATIDLAASSALTRQQLGWNPTGPDLLTDLRNMDYSVGNNMETPAP